MIENFFKNNSQKYDIKTIKIATIKIVLFDNYNKDQCTSRKYNT